MRACLIAWLGSALFLLAPSMLAAQEPVQEPAADSPQTQAQTQTPGQLASATTRVTVHGVVRNAATGEPLARALVQIEGDADTGALTDNEGRFEIPGVPAGPQLIRVAKPGFRDRPYATEDAGLQAEGPAHSVMLATQMPELAFALSPNCAIHGHIELSTGDPADGITVMLVKQVVRFGRAVWAQESSTTTNGEGTYRFGGLPDGVYALYTHPALDSEPAVSVVAAGSGANVARSGYASVFYPDARDFAGASRIRLSGGSQAEANFSLTLEPFYPVTAFGESPTSGSASSKLSPAAAAVVMDASGHPLPYFPQYDQTTHSMQVSLPDGTYFMLLHILSSGQLLPNLVLNSPRELRPSGALAGAVQFTVAGHAVAGLRVPLSAPQASTVHLRLIHSADSKSGAIAADNAADVVNLSLDPADSAQQAGSESTWSMESNQDTITFTAQPGSYWLTATLPRKGLCASAFTAGGVNLAREPLALSLASSPPPMELTLTDDCATLALTLPPALTVFLPGEEPFYTVYVVPDFDTTQDIPPMTIHPSSGATLTLDSLSPGSYHVYVFDTPVHLEYRNAAAMSALSISSQQVTLTAGSTANLLLEAPEH
jgi:Carboxypeptidase regulatory-like domain